MVATTWDDTVALDTAPIFDDVVYLSEALGLPVTQNEDDLDADLALLAREGGIQDPYRFLCPPPTQDISRALSTMTVDSDHRSSISIRSQETQSTGFTSAPSRTSRDHMHANERSPATRLQPKPMRATMSVERCSQDVNAPAPGEPRRSASTLSVAQSVLSSSSSLQQPPPRKKRSSALFAMFRKDSSSCTSRAHHGHHSKPRGVKLECGHTLSAFDIRVHIQDALQSGAHGVPNCCGNALSRTVLEGVLSREETDLVMNGAALQSPDLGSLPDSGYGEDGISSIDLSRPSKSSPLPQTIPECAPARRARHQEISVESALANEAFKSFKAQQKEQFERVSTFECNQRKALKAHHNCLLKRLAARHVAHKAEQQEQHVYDLEQLEERQLNAEHDLRESHKQETQNVATALKFMERYCLGTNVDDPEKGRVVTEEDFKKLDRQRLLQQNAPRKHENAINVLRARQERETKRRLEKQESELEQVDIDHEKEVAEMEAGHVKELERLDLTIETRRKRLLQRWDLKFEMWRRDWEEQHHTTLNAKLEHGEWPSRKADHTVIISASSSLAPYVKATA